MIRLSRRQLADYAIGHLSRGDGTKTLAKKLAAALITSRRTAEAELLIADIYDELERRGELAKASVISAHSLSKSLQAELKATVAKATGVKHVSLDETIDESLIGGLTLQTSRHSWDKSISNLLAKLKGAA